MPASGGVNSQGSLCQVHSESGVLPKIFQKPCAVLSTCASSRLMLSLVWACTTVHSSIHWSFLTASLC